MNEFIKQAVEFAKVYKNAAGESPAIREAKCLAAQYPAILAPIKGCVYPLPYNDNAVIPCLHDSDAAIIAFHINIDAFSRFNLLGNCTRNGP